jgi:diguanylate cyclase (GGDEF)-like protein/PAS domain S-box-containing protein
MIPDNSDFYKRLIDHISDGVYFVDRDRKILYWNDGASRLTGYKAEELIGTHCFDDILCHVNDRGQRLCNEYCPLAECMRDGNPREARVFLRHKAGKRVPVSVRVQPISEADGQIIGAVEIFSDDSQQREAMRRTEEMRKMATLDHLTQIPNRRYLETALQTALNEYQLYRNPFGLLVIDVDLFKEINDVFGHAGGDMVLQQTAKTLTASLRPTDVLGRWGGDEFLAIIRNANMEMLQHVAQRCVSMAPQIVLPSEIEGVKSISFSIGATMVKPEENTIELIQRADEMMYRSKAQGRNRACVG